MSLQLPTAYVPEMAPPGKHIFGAWIRYGPRDLREGTWDSWREPVRLYTPADIERETGITGASIRHLDMTLDQMLHRRPLPPWSAYKTPIEGLWLRGSGTHPCGSVTGAPGHNAAQAMLAETK